MPRRSAKRRLAGNAPKTNGRASSLVGMIPSAWGFIPVFRTTKTRPDGIDDRKRR